MDRLGGEPRVGITINIDYPRISIPLIDTAALDFITIIPALNIMNQNGAFILAEKNNNINTIDQLYSVNVDNADLINFYKTGFLIKKFYNPQDLFSFFSKDQEVIGLDRLLYLENILNIKDNVSLRTAFRLLSYTKLTIIFLCVDLEQDANGNSKYRNVDSFVEIPKSATQYLREILSNIDLDHDVDIYLELGLRNIFLVPIHNLPSGSNPPPYKDVPLKADSYNIEENIVATMIEGTKDIINILDGKMINKYENDVTYHNTFINANNLSESLIGERIITLHGWYKDVFADSRVSMMPASFAYALNIRQMYNNLMPFDSIVNRRLMELINIELVRKQKNEEIFERLFNENEPLYYFTTRVNSLFLNKNGFGVFLTDFTRKTGNTTLKQENAVRAAYKTKKWLTGFFKKIIGLRQQNIDYDNIIQQVKQGIAPLYQNSKIEYDIIIDPEKNILSNYLFVDFIIRVGINIHKIKLEIVYQ